MVSQTGISWLEETVERRDKSLRAIEDDFNFFLPESRYSGWEKTRELSIFPMSMNYMLQCMDFFQWIDDSKEHNLLRDLLLGDIKKWCSWSFKHCLVQYETIRSPIIDLLKRIEILACTGPQQYITSVAIWSRVIRRAMFEDIEDFEKSIMHAIKYQELTSSFEFWENRTFMDLLLTFLQRQKPSKRFFARCLNKLVEKTGVIPECMVSKGISRQGEHPVGGGGFADVWQGLFGDEVVALKVLRIFQSMSHRSLENTSKEFRKECMVWRQLCHPNILPLLGIDENTFRPRLAMVSPWMENGNILTYLQRGGHKKVERLKLIDGIALGLKYLHAQNPPVVHGDLRSTNILVDDKRAPRIADFGLSRILDSKLSKIESSSFRANGSMRWQPPELIDTGLFPDVKSGISTASDVYSFASVCLEIFTEEAPFPHLRRDVEVITEVVIHQKMHPKPTGDAIDRGLSDEIWLLMTECWSRHPSERPAMRDVVHQLNIKEDASLADGTSSNIFDVDVLSPPGSVIMVKPLFSELVRAVTRLKPGATDVDASQKGKLKEALDAIGKAGETTYPGFSFKRLGSNVSIPEATEYNRIYRPISDVAAGLCRSLPVLRVLGLCKEKDFRNIVRMAQQLTRQRHLLLLPASPYIFDIQDLKKMTRQLHVYIEKAITLAGRQLNEKTHCQVWDTTTQAKIASVSEAKETRTESVILAGSRINSNYHSFPTTTPHNGAQKEERVLTAKRKHLDSLVSSPNVENVLPKRTKCDVLL